jgi:alpha/beta superfamily hydrolase
VTVDVTVEGGGVALPATLTAPVGRVRGGVVVLHGASNGERSYLLYEHVAQLLAPQGIAVIRYDRRSAVAGADVPLIEQAQDALAAAETLRHRAGEVPVALWGYSQGAWAADLAANRRSAAVRGVEPSCRFGRKCFSRRSGGIFAVTLQPRHRH